MFAKKKAWFSNSVQRGTRSVWVREGGLLVDWREASYLFTDDAGCPDTQRIFLSRQYVENGLTLFHSAYISVCDRRQSVKSVPIGHYVLPPIPVQQEVKKVIGRFIWEQEDLSEDSEGSSVFETPKTHLSEGVVSLGRTESVYLPLKDLNGPQDASGSPQLACCALQKCPVNSVHSGCFSCPNLNGHPEEECSLYPD